MLDSLHALKEDVRTAIVLKYYYGYSLDEIASILHVPIGTVKSKIFYGLQKLRKELSRDDI
jgi:RNA polymerase sigma-70 factor (ECF subfamily)